MDADTIVDIIANNLSDGDLAWSSCEFGEIVKGGFTIQFRDFDEDSGELLKTDVFMVKVTKI